MDINVCLATLRELMNALREDAINMTPNFDRMGDAANSFEELDEWMSKGGFLPDAWDSKKQLAKLLQPVDEPEHFGGLR